MKHVKSNVETRKLNRDKKQYNYILAKKTI